MDSTTAVQGIIEEILEKKIDIPNFQNMTLSEIGLNSMAVLNVLFKIEEYTNSDLSSFFDEMEPPNTVMDLINLYQELKTTNV